MKAALVTLIILVIITGCSNAEIGNIKDVNPATVYTSYYLYYDQGVDSSVTFKAQFTFAGPNGTSLVLNSPAHITLDGETLSVDSTPMEGAFYEVHKPANAFSGNHIVTFTNVDGKVYTNHFDFTPVNLQPLPANISAKTLTLATTGLASTDSLEVRLDDTSDVTANIDTVLIVKDNRVILPVTLLDRLTAGPVTIQAGRNYTKQLEQTTAEGGMMFYSYALPQKETLLKK